MASTRIPYILSLFLLFSCIWTQRSAGSTKTAKVQKHDLIEKVCSKAMWPNFCLKALSPYSGGSATADLPGIANVSLNLAQSHALATKSLMGTLLKQRGSDPKIKRVLTDCSNIFNYGINLLSAAKNYLVAKDYDNVNNQSALAQENIYDCFITLDDGPSRKLQAWVSDEFNYCNILCETSGLLLGGKDYDCV